MSRLLIANNRTEAMVGDLTALTETARRAAGCGAQRTLWFAEGYLDYVTSWTRLTRGRRDPLVIELTPAEGMLFTEINCRVSGASHMCAAIARCLGDAGLSDRLVLLRDGWTVPSFDAVITRIEDAGRTLDRVTRTGVLPDGDMTSVNGTFGVSILAKDADGPRDCERRLDDLFR